MKREAFLKIEAYMRACMQDSAHDTEHIYRVLYLALEIAQTEKRADRDVLLAACLLHDIGRQAQFENPALCHAAVGAEMAFAFLVKNGFPEPFAAHVRACIAAHRFRKGSPPVSIEAKILYDADKIDVCGAVGVARTLLYQGQMAEPLYTLLPDGTVSDGEADTTPSFFQEYKRKLQGIEGRLFTQKGREIAAQRQGAAEAFYNSLLREVREPYECGRRLLADEIES